MKPDVVSGSVRSLGPADGTVDSWEREVLRSIFDRVTEDTVSAKVWAEIEDFRTRFDIV